MRHVSFWPAAAASYACLLALTWTLARRAGYLSVALGVSDCWLVPLDVAAFLAALLMLWAGAPDGRRKRALSSMAASVVFGLVLIARTNAPSWPIRDGAMLELYTVHALHGAQLLGAFSQYGWHHPGPLLFYLLAPFYALGGRSALALNTGVLALNLASLIALAVVVRRRTRQAPLAGASILALTALFLFRVPGLLTSAWNPHAPVLPFTLFLILSADVMCGEVAALPVVAFLASFVVQAHVAYAPVAVAILGLDALAGAVTALRSLPERRRFFRYALVSAIVLQVCWLLPIADQLASRSGNMTQVLHYFSVGGAGPTARYAISVWGNALVAPLLSAFSLPVGWPLTPRFGALGAVAGAASVVLLVPVAVWASRAKLPFCRGLAVVCLAASVVGLLAVFRIQNVIGDYQVFWLSVTGLLNVALIAGAGLTLAVSSWLSPKAGLNPFVTAFATALVVAATAVGVTDLVHQRTPDEPTGDAAAVRDLTRQTFDALRLTAGTRYRPLLRIGPGLWAVPTGLVLQFAKASIPFTVDTDVAPLFGMHLRTTSHEDLLLTVGDRTLHEELAKRPDNVVLAHDADSEVFIDMISLVDHPQYRAPDVR